jgi:hypothetical protein
MRRKLRACVGARAESAVCVTDCVLFSIVASVGPPEFLVCRLEGGRPAAPQPGFHSSASLAAPRRHWVGILFCPGLLSRPFPLRCDTYYINY